MQWHRSEIDTRAQRQEHASIIDRYRDGRTADQRTDRRAFDGNKVGAVPGSQRRSQTAYVLPARRLPVGCPSDATATTSTVAGERHTLELANPTVRQHEQAEMRFTTCICRHRAHGRGATLDPRSSYRRSRGFLSGGGTLGVPRPSFQKPAERRPNGRLITTVAPSN